MYAKGEGCITLYDTNILAVTLKALHLRSVLVHMPTHVLQNWGQIHITCYENHVNEAALHEGLLCNMKWHCKVMNSDLVTILKLITVANIKVL